jgi:cell division septation protein DedD
MKVKTVWLVLLFAVTVFSAGALGNREKNTVSSQQGQLQEWGRPQPHLLYSPAPEEVPMPGEKYQEPAQPDGEHQPENPRPIGELADEVYSGPYPEEEYEVQELDENYVEVPARPDYPQSEPPSRPSPAPIEATQRIPQQSESSPQTVTRNQGNRPASGLYRIQVWAFREEPNAGNALQKLQELGFPAEIERFGAWHRVVIPRISPPELDGYLRRLTAVGFGRRDQGYIWVRNEPAARPATDMFGRRVSAGSGRVYTVQVAAFPESDSRSAEREIAALCSAGLSPRIDRFNFRERGRVYLRVVIPDVSARDMAQTLQRLGDAGYSSVWIRD